jgi:hypothetical protein
MTTAAAAPLRPASATVSGTAGRGHGGDDNIWRSGDVCDGFCGRDAFDLGIMRIDDMNGTAEAARGYIYDDMSADGIVMGACTDHSERAGRHKPVEAIGRHWMSFRSPQSCTEVPKLNHHPAVHAPVPMHLFERCRSATRKRVIASLMCVNVGGAHMVRSKAATLWD